MYLVLHTEKKNFILKKTSCIIFEFIFFAWPPPNTNLETNKKRGRRKQATPALVQRISTGPINPALQSFN
ncbi:hypothetical protein BpHYR1_034587 [Brachionus plicatilis]|uniref:Uncharacterized protein n=1 Tax=Brachionus plicatilis TaxID=10195 RepID=A0A3M7RFU4_BRAPC|nr:hypothetical protein BpHYR1_034587 [Brachionus plicatilis]